MNDEQTARLQAAQRQVDQVRRARGSDPTGGAAFLATLETWASDMRRKLAEAGESPPPPPPPSRLIVEASGDFLTFSLDQPECRPCAGSGWVEGGQPCGVCSRLRFAAKRLNAVRIPAEFAHAEVKEGWLGAPAIVPHRKALHDWLTNWTPDSPSLALLGKTHRGKSHTAACIVRLLVERGATARWIDLPTLIRKMRRLFSNPGAADELVESLCGNRVDLLVLDDVGAGEHGQDWVLDLYEQLIRGRIVKGRCVVFTANFPVTPAHPEMGDRGIADVVGDRSWSRVEQRGLIIETRGPAYMVKS